MPDEQTGSLRTKIVGVASLCRVREELRALGRTVVQCHGCFDIVHPGHVRHLQHAARQGDALIVSITADVVVGKGDGRPLFPQELRAENLAALDCVDWVCINPEPTAEGLLDAVRPDIYVKGAEYETNRDERFIAERRAVERHGGRVLFSSGDIVFSSTAIVSSMEATESPVHSTLRRTCESHALSAGRLESVVDGFLGKRVCVIGESILDTYLFCDRPDIAGEGPVMSLRPLERRSYDGGAGVIARHLASLGARPTLITALPETSDASAMRLRLEAQGIEIIAIQHDGPLLEKQRFLVGTQKVVKLDLVRPIAIDSRGRERLVSIIGDVARRVDACIVADFGNGMLSPGLLESICADVRGRVGLLAGDVSGRRSGLLHLRDLDLVCPTEVELRESMHEYDESLNAVVWRFMERTGARSVIATLGPDGVIAFARPSDESGDPDHHARLLAEHLPAVNPAPIDVLGCGDALLGAAVLARLAGGGLMDAAVLGSIAAGASASRVGNEVVTPDDLRRGVRRICSSRLSVARITPGYRAVV